MQWKVEWPHSEVCSNHLTFRARFRFSLIQDWGKCRILLTGTFFKKTNVENLKPIRILPYNMGISFLFHAFRIWKKHEKSVDVLVNFFLQKFNIFLFFPGFIFIARMNRLLLFKLFILMSWASLKVTLARTTKSFSLFSVVTFKNEECTTVMDSGMNGLCQSVNDCSENSGTASGNCASGFGVCCFYK